MTGLSELFHDLADEAKFYDVTEGALRGAKRRRRARLAVAPVAVVAVVMAAAVAVAPASGPAPLVSPSLSPTGSPVVAFPKACVPQVLAMPPGFGHAIVTGGDPSGRHILGWLSPGSSAAMPVMWVDGVPQVLTLPGKSPVLVDMNSAGVAVGVANVSSGPSKTNAAFVYHSGKVSMLRGELTTVRAISDSGVIIGAVGDRPALWRSADGEPQLLPVPDGMFGTFSDIDDDNTAIGDWVTDRRPPTWYTWLPDGTAQMLPGERMQFSIRRGWVAGSEGGKALRWNVATGVTEQLAGQLDGLYARINAQGWALGTTRDGGVQLASPTQFVMLPPPPDAPTGGRNVKVLSDDGRIAAGWLSGYTPTQVGPEVKATPVLWHCS